MAVNDAPTEKINATNRVSQVVDLRGHGGGAELPPPQKPYDQVDDGVPVTSASGGARTP